MSPNQAGTLKEQVSRHSAASIQLSITPTPPQKGRGGGQVFGKLIRFQDREWDRTR